MLCFDNFEYDTQPEDFVEWVHKGFPPSVWDLSRLVCKIRQVLQQAKTDYLILDYPFGRADYPVKDFLDLAVFVDTLLDVALARRLLRDCREASAQTIREELRFYLEQFRICFIAYAGFQTFCDVSVEGSGSVEGIAQTLLSHIQARKMETETLRNERLYGMEESLC